MVCYMSCFILPGFRFPLLNLQHLLVQLARALGVVVEVVHLQCAIIYVYHSKLIMHIAYLLI